jgi:hypothetical protein
MRTGLSFAVGVALLLAPQARAGLIFVVDENCNGFYTQNGGPITTILCRTDVTDPLNGDEPLTYFLPAAASALSGDLEFVDSKGKSDLIRFIGNTLLFYSDAEAFDPDKADVGVPADRQPNAILGLNEVFLDDNLAAGIFYVPTAGQPGFGPNGNAYYLVSDTVSGYDIRALFVPEPPSGPLLAGGAGLIALFRLARRRRA